MKVAFISTLYAPNHIGGAEQAVRLLAESLVARGHEAVVISLNPAAKFDKRIIEGVTVYYVPLANIYWPHVPPEQRPPWRAAIWHLIDAYNPIMGARVRKILAAEKPDVVESNNLQGFSVAAWRAAQRLGIPVVQILHDYYLGCPNSSMFKRGRNCAKQCGVCTVYTTPRRLLSGIPKVVSSVSRHMLERLERTGMFGRVPRKTVVRTAFNFTGAAQPRSDKPPGSPLTVGYLGRLEEVKGIELLLRALQELPTQKITLLIAGSGVPAYVDDLKRRYGRANIKFLGFTEPAAFFSSIDAVVVPSVWEEPLSRVIFEGCAFGVPAIVARIGGMPEIVEEGVTGYVFEPNDVAALAGQLRSVIDQGLPAQRMQEACRKKSMGFGVDEVFRAHLANWRHAIAQQSPGLTPANSVEIS